MKKNQCISLSSLVFIALSWHTGAQPHNEALQQMISAERAFAQWSAQQNTRAAFLANLSPSSVLYAQGEVVSGSVLWEKIPADSALLTWWPVYADISQAGDLGYTTGPFQYFKSRGDKTPVSTGYYSTVWKKEADGKWKVATDLGIGVRDQQAFTVEVRSPSTPGQPATVDSERSRLESLEAEYTLRLNAKAVSYLPEFIADEFRIHRPSVMPCTSADQLASLNEQQRKYTFERSGSSVASSGDFAFAYGKVKIEATREGSVRTLAANYLRVWKRMNGDWKIVLDVIGIT